MKGDNEIAPLLYSFDAQKLIYEAQEQVGHHLYSNGSAWSLDGSKFYFICSMYGEIRQYNYIYG